MSLKLPEYNDLYSCAARVRAAQELNSYLCSCAVKHEFPDIKIDSCPENLLLPDCEFDGQVGFFSVVADRRSSYDCASGPLSESALSILASAVEFSPSAGGLKSTTPFFIFPREENLTNGNTAAVYEFQRSEVRVLRGHGYIEKGDLKKAILQAEFVERFPLIIVLVAKLEIMFEKYSLKNYQMLYADAGVMLQNLQLTSQACNLVSCMIGGVNTNLMEALLGLDPKRIVTMAFAVGNSN